MENSFIYFFHFTNFWLMNHEDRMDSEKIAIAKYL